MDLFEEGPTGTNAPEFTVSELSGAVKRLIEGEFSHVRIRGEVGRVSRPASGHVYLDLKDDRAVLAGVIWKGTARQLDMQPEEGMEVIATGRLTTFPGSSRYQIIIETIAPAGVGALMAMLEKRRKALAAEGLFNADRKRPLPYLPEVVGVVTSPSGAVIRDILHRLRERFPRRVILWPVPVQGEKCAPAVAQAIAGLNALEPGGDIPRPDVLIVARGGGSLEDLWGFNEEAVVRAVAASSIPVISAIGHETDTTLIDHVADRRAPTPTAAAEMAVPVRDDLVVALANLEHRRRGALTRDLSQKTQRLRDLGRGLPRPEMLLADRAQRLDTLSMRLPRALLAFAQSRRVRLGQGPAARFGPHLLTQVVDRRRQTLALHAQGLRPAVMLNGLKRLSSDVETRSARLHRVGGRLTENASFRLKAQSSLLQSLGPAQVLKRGYAIVRDDKGAVLTRASEAKKAVSLELEFSDGRMTPGKATPKRAKKTDPKQDTLF